jgi:UDP-N-acetylglucosamine acyltransferase
VATNSIHPTAVIGPGVSLGADNVVAPYAVIFGPCSIGDSNWIGPHVSIGTPAQMRDGSHPAGWEAAADTTGITIGDGNVIREYVTIHQPIEQVTAIGNNCYLMSYAHVPHDASIGDGVTLSNAVQLGGHTTIAAGANVGLGAMVHQRLTVGSGAMIGMGSIVTKPVPPFAVVYGNPARLAGANRVGLARAGYDDEVAAVIAEHYRGDPAAPLPAGLPDELVAAFAIFRDAVGNP